MDIQGRKILGLLAMVATSLSPSLHQGSVVANIRTKDGAILRVSGVTFVYREHHTAPGYMSGRGPLVTKDHGGMEHLPVSVPFGTVFVPFQTISRVAASLSSGNVHDSGTVSVTLSDGSLLKGTLGADFLRRGAWLEGEGAFGPVRVELNKIVELSFETPAAPSKTFRPVARKAGGPFSITIGSEVFELSALWTPASFNRRTNRFDPAKLEVGGVSFEPDFSNVASIRVTKRDGKATVEVATEIGERLVGEYRSTRDWLVDDYIGLLGESKAGAVFVDLDRSMQITKR